MPFQFFPSVVAFGPSPRSIWAQGIFRIAVAQNPSEAVRSSNPLKTPPASHLAMNLRQGERIAPLKDEARNLENIQAISDFGRYSSQQTRIHLA